MKYYQEIVIRQVEEIDSHFIMSKVMTEIHKLLAKQLHTHGKVFCGLSYPEYSNKNKRDLGKLIRIFAPEEDLLSEMNLSSALKDLSDYAAVLPIKEVPENIVTYAMYKRYHKGNSIGNQAKRYVKRHPDSDTQKVMQMFALAEKNHKKEDYPYVIMKSSSNSHTYSYFVIKEIQNEPKDGTFSTYGMSLGGTVPEF